MDNFTLGAKGRLTGYGEKNSQVSPDLKNPRLLHTILTTLVGFSILWQFRSSIARSLYSNELYLLHVMFLSFHSTTFLCIYFKKFWLFVILQIMFETLCGFGALGFVSLFFSYSVFHLLLISPK